MYICIFVVYILYCSCVKHPFYKNSIADAFRSIWPSSGLGCWTDFWTDSEQNDSYRMQNMWAFKRVVDWLALTEHLTGGLLSLLSPECVGPPLSPLPCVLAHIWSLLDLLGVFCYVDGSLLRGDQTGVPVSACPSVLWFRQCTTCRSRHNWIRKLG